MAARPLYADILTLCACPPYHPSTFICLHIICLRSSSSSHDMSVKSKGGAPPSSSSPSPTQSIANTTTSSSSSSPPTLFTAGAGSKDERKASKKPRQLGVDKSLYSQRYKHATTAEVRLHTLSAISCITQCAGACRCLGSWLLKKPTTNPSDTENTLISRSSTWRQTLCSGRAWRMLLNWSLKAG